jgi:hypothetical protein
MRSPEANGDCRDRRAPTGRRSVRHHQPSLRVQRSKTNEMVSMIKHKMISGIHLVESLTMTFMPKTDDSDVIGR